MAGPEPDAVPPAGVLEEEDSGWLDGAGAPAAAAGGTRGCLGRLVSSGKVGSSSMSITSHTRGLRSTRMFCFSICAAGGGVGGIVNRNALGPKWCLERWEQSGRPLTSSPLYFILGSLNLGSSVLLVLCPTQPMASSIRKAFSGLKTAAWEVGQGGGGQGD